MIKKLKNENGYTVAEIMVAISLFISLIAIVTVTAVTLTSNSKDFVSLSEVQRSTADGSATIMRDINSSVEINTAENYLLNITVKQNDITSDVIFFYWHPTVETNVSVPAGIQTSELPDFPALMMKRQQQGEETYTLNVLVKNFNSSYQTETLFTYYDINNTEMLTPIVENNINSIKRISFHFTAKTTDEKYSVETKNSATPRSTLTNIIQ
jgi:hypothetical protein